MRRRVTFSRNLTLSLSRTCRCYCKYCSFASHSAHLYTPEEVLAILDGAARRHIKELLVLTGERPEVNPEVHARLRCYGHEDFTAYVAWACERALERGLLPHTNLGVLSSDELARLREVTASQGLMLESSSERLMATVHAGSPSKHPARRLATIRAAGQLKIPFTSRILVGIQVPPNLSDWWGELVAAGATDLGGLSANGDHISPEHPFPSPHQVRKALQREGYALTERLCVYASYIDPEWVSPAVMDTIKRRYWSFIPRRGSGRTEPPAPIRPELVARAAQKGRDGVALDADELTALFAETRVEAIEEIRQAADELRQELAGDTVTFVVNRNINVSNICVVGCAFCGFGQGKRSPDAYEHDREEFVRRVLEAVDYGATELCIQSGIHPDWTLEDYLGWLALAKETAPQLHLHAYSPMEVAHMCDISGLPAAEVFARLRHAGLGSTPGTAAEVLHDGVRERISPNKLPVARWVEIIEACHRAGVRSTATVMFGHIEEPWELAEHMRVVRELQERTQGITEFVPLSFIPFQTLLGRTHGVQEISREENLKHTAVFRLALGRTITSVQASWVKMGLDAATEALRWGVNDLGGTLMEESISRLAGSYHGTRLEPHEFIAAAHRAGRPAAERTTLYEVRRRYPLRGEAHVAALAAS